MTIICPLFDVHVHIFQFAPLPLVSYVTGYDMLFQHSKLSLLYCKKIGAGGVA